LRPTNKTNKQEGHFSSLDGLFISTACGASRLVRRSNSAVLINAAELYKWIQNYYFGRKTISKVLFYADMWKRIPDAFEKVDDCTLTTHVTQKLPPSLIDHHW